MGGGMLVAIGPTCATLNGHAVTSSSRARAARVAGLEVLAGDLERAAGVALIVAVDARDAVERLIRAGKRQQPVPDGRWAVQPVS